MKRPLRSAGADEILIRVGHRTAFDRSHRTTRAEMPAKEVIGVLGEENEQAFL